MASERSSVWLQDLTWQDFEAYVEESEHPTVIVPIGSTEQHGPHLPVGVDAYQADGFAEAIAERVDIVTAPTIWYGDANHHLAFPGTVSLRTETVIEVLKDVYTSLIHHGVENIVTVNGHRMANLPAIDIASKQTKEDHPDVFFATMDMVKMGVRIYNDMRDGDPEAGMHGGEFETSFMMANHADLVKEEEFVPETSEKWTRFTSLDYTGIDDNIGIAGSRHDWGEEALGHQGDPTHASAEKGEELVTRLVDNAEEFLEDLWALRTKQRESGSESLGLSY